jgi:hypothetical protein
VTSFVKYDLGQLPAGASVTVTLRQPANVRLLNAHEFARYQRGESCRGIGGRAVRSPINLETPSADHWYVVLDLGGAGGQINSSVSVTR